MAESHESLTITIRLIRSFEHRNIRHLVLKGVDSQCTVKELMDQIRRDVGVSSQLPPPFKKHKYDCMKINSYAFGAKTNDTAITLNHDNWELSPSQTLLEANIKNETEISFFNKADYDKYKANPQLLW